MGAGAGASAAKEAIGAHSQAATEEHAAAKPPADADRFREVDALLESIRSGAVRLLRGSHIIQRAKAGQPLQRRQELPDAAFCHYDDLMLVLQKLREKFGKEDTAQNEFGDLKRGGDTRFMGLIHVLSYRWITKDHPDPECFHLRIVAEVTEARIQQVSSTGRRIGLWKDVFEPIGMSEADVDIAMFWDFGSLFQIDRVKHVDDRTEAQKQLFKGALSKGGALNVLYGHLHTSVWMQSELPKGFEEQMAALNLARTYKESGWCHVEASMSALLKPITRRLDLSKRNTPTTNELGYVGYRLVEFRCAIARDPPLSPQAMSVLVRTQKRFTGKGDLEIVDAMYAEFFDAVAPTVEQLYLADLKWGTEEACELAEVLPCFSVCRKLNLSYNDIGIKGAAAIFEALHKAPSIQSVGMKFCFYDDKERVALADMLKNNSTVTSIDLGGGDALRDESALALAEAIACNTTLKSLNLEAYSAGHCSHEDLGEAGAMALAEAIGCNSTLKYLNLRYNVPESGKVCQALKDAIVVSNSKRGKDNQLALLI